MKIVSGASGAAHWSGCSLPPHRIDVEDIIAYLPQRRLVVLAIDGDVAGGALDRGRGLGQPHDRTALQQPNQARAIIAAQPPVRWVRPLWRGVEGGQVAAVPAEALGLRRPLCQQTPGG